MALSIRDEETDRLVRELAEATGETMTAAIRGAVRDRLARQRATARAEVGTATLQAIIDRGRRRAVIDARPADEILGYDESGLPS